MEEQSGRNEYTHQRMLRIIAEAERLGYAEDREMYWVDDRGHGIPGAGLTLADLREIVARGEAMYDKIEEIERLGFDPDDLLGPDDDGGPRLRRGHEERGQGASRFRELRKAVEGGAGGARE